MSLHKRLYEIYLEKTESAVENSAELAVILDDRASSGCSDAVFMQGVHNQLANGSYIALTATEDGEISLSMPFDGILEDLIDRSTQATQNRKISWQTKSNLCRLYRWQRS